MTQYSRERVRDVSAEFAFDCKDLDVVIETFARLGLGFEIPFETLRRHLRTIGSTLALKIRERPIRPDDDDDALALLSFLHETGFLNPRLTDDRQPKGFRHLVFHDGPDFVTKANWNKLQSATWEIHPAFRSFLQTSRSDAIARL